MMGRITESAIERLSHRRPVIDLIYCGLVKEVFFFGGGLIGVEWEINAIEAMSAL